MKPSRVPVVKLPTAPRTLVGVGVGTTTSTVPETVPEGVASVRVVETEPLVTVVMEKPVALGITTSSVP